MKKLIKTLVSYFLMFEGIDHFIISTISVVGLVHLHTYNWASWFSPIVDYVMGAGTLLSGLYLRRRKG